MEGNGLRRLRMSSAPFCTSVIQLNLEGRIWRTEVFLWIGHIAGGTPELPQCNIGHLAEAFADWFDVLGIRLNHSYIRSKIAARPRNALVFVRIEFSSSRHRHADRSQRVQSSNGVAVLRKHFVQSFVAVR
jgi:hypothetical protein